MLCCSQNVRCAEFHVFHAGVNLYGVGSWAEIRREQVFVGRTDVNLKDHWRAIVKAVNGGDNPRSRLSRDLDREDKILVAEILSRRT